MTTRNGGASAAGARAGADMVGDERVLEATGRSRADWFALLDAAGAASWDHTRIASFLRDEHDVPAWWCQSVTVAYEQERGLRLPGQKADGTFAASASKTVAASRQAVEQWLTAAELLAQWAGEGVESVSKKGAKVPKLRSPNGTVAAVYLDESTAKDGTARTKVAVQVEKLSGPEVVAAAKEHWKGALAELARLVAGA